MRHWFADRFELQASSVSRILTSALIAVAILAMPLPAVVQGVSLAHHLPKHLPRKHLAKTRMLSASYARSSSLSGSVIRPRTAKRRSMLPAGAFTDGHSSACADLQHVFRPLRC